MTTLSELITTLKGKMLPLTGGTLSGNLEIGGNATVSGKNIVRSINGTVAGTDGNVTLDCVTESDILEAADKAIETVTNVGNTDLANVMSAVATVEANLEEKETVDSSGMTWIRYKGGLQICWGYTDAVKNGDVIVTFPVPFKGQYSFTLSQSSAATTTTMWTLFARGETTPTTVKVYSNAATSFEWQAIGFWK